MGSGRGQSEGGGVNVLATASTLFPKASPFQNLPNVKRAHPIYVHVKWLKNITDKFISDTHVWTS